MIRLNLIPYNRLQEIEAAKDSRFVKIFFVFGMVFFIMTVGLMFSQLILAKRISSSAIGKLAPSVLQERAAEINKKAKILGEIQDGFVFFSDSLADFANAVPGGVTIEELNLIRESEEIIAKGLSENENVLEIFKKNLEELDRFSDINFLLKNEMSDGRVYFEIFAKNKFSGIGGERNL